MTRASPRRGGRPPDDSGPSTARVLWAAWRVSAWGAMLVGAVWGLHHLEGRFQATRATVPCRLEWVDLPAWLTKPGHEWILQGAVDERTGTRAAAGIADAAGLHPDETLLDPTLCARVGTGLQACPWVGRVHRVTKRPDGAIRVQADYREPVACVVQRGLAYVVDAAGVRLPVDYNAETPGLSDSLFMITGVAAPLPEPGAAWPGADLAAGLKLVTFLRDAHALGSLPFRSSLRAIDVSHKSAKDVLLHIQLPQPGAYIDWGMPPGEEYDVDTATANRKLEMLNAAFAAEGAFLDRIIQVRWADRIRYLDPRRR